jgi:hypothetical protein
MTRKRGRVKVVAHRGRCPKITLCGRCLSMAIG